MCCAVQQSVWLGSVINNLSNIPEKVILFFANSVTNSEKTKKMARCTCMSLDLCNLLLSVAKQAQLAKRVTCK